MHKRAGSQVSTGQEEVKQKPASKQHSRRQSTSSKGGDLAIIKITNRAVYKTKMCNRPKLANGVCARGAACWYAHSQDELRRPDQDVESYMEARGITNYVIID